MDGAIALSDEKYRIERSIEGGWICSSLANGTTVSPVDVCRSERSVNNLTEWQTPILLVTVSFHPFAIFPSRILEELLSFRPESSRSDCFQQELYLSNNQVSTIV